MATKCCKLECFKNITYNDVEKTRKKYLSLQNHIEKRNFILAYVKDHKSSSRNSSGTVQGEKISFHVKGKTVCKQAWLLVHNINDKRFNAIVRDFINGSELYQHGNTGKVRKSMKTSECSAWLNFFVNAIGDQQPDSGKIHLPSCFTKLSLYKKMCEDLDEEVLVSQSQFYGIMDRQFGHVLIPKV